MKKHFLILLSLYLLTVLLSFGCAPQGTPPRTTDTPAEEQKQTRLPKGAIEIKTAELKALIKNKTDFTLIDARPWKRYAASHIAGALNLPVPLYQKKAAFILPQDKDGLLVVYCDGSACTMSTQLAALAIKNGYSNVHVYLPGLPGWIKAGQPVYAAEETVEKGNIVLIDLRPVKKSEAGRIPRSVTIPYGSLEDRIEDIPIKAPIILYSDSIKEAAAAVQDLRDEGFRHVALVPGNYAGWLQAGGKTVTGPVVTDIHWTRIPGPGEVSRVDFLKAARGMDSTAVLLDVRTEGETAAGRFKHAIAIPLDQVGSRLAELPKDKKIYVYCSIGARAEMAARELKKNGYRAFFLLAEVECQGDDCTVDY